MKMLILLKKSSFLIEMGRKVIFGQNDQFWLIGYFLTESVFLIKIVIFHQNSHFQLFFK